MRKTESGTTLIEFDHQDELLGPVTLDMSVDWTLTPGLLASRTEPEEEPDLEVEEIRLTVHGRTIPCPDDVFSAFATDAGAIAGLRARVKEQIRDMAEMAADDAAHAAMGPDF